MNELDVKHQTKPGCKVIEGLDYSTAVIFSEMTNVFFSSSYGSDFRSFCRGDAAVLEVGLASPAHKAN